MQNISRRKFFINSAAMTAGAAAMSTLGARDAAAALKKAVYITPFKYLIGFAPTQNAQVGGHFARHGLDVEILGGTNAPMAIGQVLVGRADFGRGSGLDVVRVVGNEGADLISIATIFQAAPFVIISQKSAPIRDAKGFTGKTVGVPGRKGGAENSLDILLASANLKAKDVPRQAAGNGLGAWGLVQSGKLDGAVVSVSALVQIIDAGEDPHHWMTDKYVPMPGQVYWMRRERIAKDPDLPVQFLRGVRDSMEELRNGDQPALLKRMADAYPLIGKNNLPFLLKAMHEEIKLWDAEGMENNLRNMPHRWEAISNSMTAAGLAKKTDASSLYTNEYLDKI